MIIIISAKKCVKINNVFSLLSLLSRNKEMTLTHLHTKMKFALANKQWAIANHSSTSVKNDEQWTKN